MASGSVRPGDDVVVLPSGLSTRVKAVETFDGPQEEALAGDAIVLTTMEELDISRGDMIVRLRNLPSRAAGFEAYLCWMDTEPLSLARSYVLLHTTRQVQAFVTRVDYRVDVDTLHRQPGSALGLNDVANAQ